MSPENGCSSFLGFGADMPWLTVPLLCTYGGPYGTFDKEFSGVVRVVSEGLDTKALFNRAAVLILPLSATLTELCSPRERFAA
jgi:hypothetical protein